MIYSNTHYSNGCLSNHLSKLLCFYASMLQFCGHSNSIHRLRLHLVTKKQKPFLHDRFSCSRLKLGSDGGKAFPGFLGVLCVQLERLEKEQEEEEEEMAKLKAKEKGKRPAGKK